MKIVVGLIVVTVISAISVPDAMAMAEFKKAFAAKYAAKHQSKEFQTAAKKASCNVCHVKGPKKTVQNEYGKLLNKLIEGDAFDRKKKAKAEGGLDAQKKEVAKLLAELDIAFSKLEKEKSDGGKGPTYGELIKAGKLPVDPVKAVEDYKAEKAKADAKAEVKEG